MIELKDFIMEKSHSCKRMILLSPTVRTDKDIPNKNYESFILEKSPSCKKIALLLHTVSTDKESARIKNEIFTNRLNEQRKPYITHNNIAKKLNFLDLHLDFFLSERETLSHDFYLHYGFTLCILDSLIND